MEFMAQQIKKVLVTGGAGFIGSALIAALQNVGHEIYVIDNLSFGNRKLIRIPAGTRNIQLGNLEPKRDFIHTYDMASAIIKLLETFDDGIETFNLGRGIEYSVIELVKAFEQELGEEITIQVDLARVRKVERMHLLADISKLKNFIDWEPKISLSQGISTLIAHKQTKLTEHLEINI
jgi:nucleoside-diphosphate-sugar epimerase